ncbi:MAG: transketolase [Chloroflexales bacterium]|nr:transketolase [Chloroflexales bacterium]
MSTVTSPKKIDKLQTMATAIRRRDLEMIYGAKLGHIGGDFSVTDILVTLYFSVLRVDPTRPDDPERDRFILSKGHSAGALYTTLAHIGFFPLAELATFAQPLSRLNGHPNRVKVPGVETNTGPLGHGLPVAVGCAIGAKMDGASWRTFVITGDGELQEGSNWEAAMSAAHYKLDNLTVIVDRNGLQQGDFTERTMHLDPLADKWRAFGWAVHEVNGHDHAALLHIFDQLPFEWGKPNCIIAHTHKGQGVSFMRDRPAWHHKVPDADEYTRALQELDAGGHADD